MSLTLWQVKHRAIRKSTGASVKILAKIAFSADVQDSLLIINKGTMEGTAINAIPYVLVPPTPAD